MKLYAVELGIDRAGVDTGERVNMTTLATDRLSAGIQAEKACDALLPDPSVQYTHAVCVREVNVTPVAEAA